jgi:WD40 repeat protein
VETRKAIGEPLNEHSAAVNTLAFSPDGKTLASGSNDRKIILWDVKTRQTTPLSGHSGFITSLAFSPDGQTLASGSYDRSVILWDVASHQPIAPLIWHDAPVQSVAFSPDGKSLISSSHDILLWDLNPQTWIKRSCQIAGRNFTPAEWKQYFPNKLYPSKPEDATCPQWPLESEATATPTAVP